MKVTPTILQAKTGCPDALGELLDFYRPYLLRLAEETISSGLRPKLSASDVAQGALVSAFDHFDQFKGDTTDDLRAWLLAIFRNHLTDGIRRYYVSSKRSIQKEVIGGSALHAYRDTDPADQAEDAESVARLIECIAQLPKNARRIVRLRYIEARTFIEIGIELDCTPDMARRKWLSAVEELSHRLNS